MPRLRAPTTVHIYLSDPAAASHKTTVKLHLRLTVLVGGALGQSQNVSAIMLAYYITAPVIRNKLAFKVL